MAPTAVVRLHLADVTTPAWHPLPNTVVPIFGYIVRFEDTVLLFDTGVGPAHEAIDALYQPRRASLPDLLASANVAMSDVQIVANCHLHFDHCGGNQLFPHARIVVQRAELEATRTPAYTVPEWVHFDGARLDIVEGDHAIADGVRVVSTPGHTHGHQSLVVDTSNGPTVLAGQVAESARDFAAGASSWNEELAEAGAESVAKLKALSPARVLFAHDAGEWSRTPKDQG